MLGWVDIAHHCFQVVPEILVGGAHPATNRQLIQVFRIALFAANSNVVELGVGQEQSPFRRTVVEQPPRRFFFARPRVAENDVELVRPDLQFVVSVIAADVPHETFSIVIPAGSFVRSFGDVTPQSKLDVKVVSVCQVASGVDQRFFDLDSAGVKPELRSQRRDDSKAAAPFAE